MNAATTTPAPRTAESTMPDLITYDLYIDGRSTKPASGLYFSSDNPYTGEIWASIARLQRRQFAARPPALPGLRN